MNDKAFLILSDGSIFRGHSLGSAGTRCGEAVFHTAMSGYQEVITDPSYAEQIVTFTNAHIGNVGCNPNDEEAGIPHLSGVVIKEYTDIPSNWRAEESLPAYFKRHHIVAIGGIDTRRLTRLLREKGAQNACITTELSEEHALKSARDFPSLEGMDLAKKVTCKNYYRLGDGNKYQVVVYDFGVKKNILDLLVSRGCHLTVVPATTSVADVLALKPQGVVLSNGPGDPAACDYAISAVKDLMKAGLPLLGICLGHQILALACGAQAEKMKFGHHGANHPVQELSSGKVFITSQNHGFTVKAGTLPNTLMMTHRSLFDASLQGFRHKQLPIFGFQGHPEASPGPHDIQPLFDEFIKLLQ